MKKVRQNRLSNGSGRGGVGGRVAAGVASGDGRKVGEELPIRGMGESLNWFKCDGCRRWNIYENTGLEEKLGAFDEEKLDNATDRSDYCYLNSKFMKLEENADIPQNVCKV